MKADFKTLVAVAVARVLPGLGLAVPASSEIQVDRTRDPRSWPLIAATRQVLRNGVALLEVSAPEAT